MIDYRRIRIADVDAMTAFAIAAIPADPRLFVSREKVVAMVSHFALHYDHFQLAAFDGNRPVGGIAVLVQEMPFHARAEGVVVFCFAAVPGVGLRLLRAMVRWFDEDLRMRRLVWAMNGGFDQRIRELSRLLGFTSEHPTFVMHKGD